MPRQIGYVIGSLRKESINRKLANALIKLGPPDFNFKELRIGDLPLYNQDDDKAQAPEVQRLKSELRAVDAVMFVTAEYNRSIPGVLKNALDNASRPYGQSAWAGKPAGIIGASVGALGTARRATSPAHHPGLSRHAHAGTARGLPAGQGRLLRRSRQHRQCRNAEIPARLDGQVRRLGQETHGLTPNLAISGRYMSVAPPAPVAERRDGQQPKRFTRPSPNCARSEPSRLRRPSRMSEAAPLIVRLLSPCKTLGVEERAGGIAFRLQGATEKPEFSITCLLHHSARLRRTNYRRTGGGRAALRRPDTRADRTPARRLREYRQVAGSPDLPQAQRGIARGAGAQAQSMESARIGVPISRQAQVREAPRKTHQP